jgi:hypothetical protein
VLFVSAHFCALCWQPKAHVVECWGIIAEAGAELAAATKLQFLMLYVCGVPKQTDHVAAPG